MESPGLVSGVTSSIAKSTEQGIPVSLVVIVFSLIRYKSLSTLP